MDRSYAAQVYIKLRNPFSTDFLDTSCWVEAATVTSYIAVDKEIARHFLISDDPNKPHVQLINAPDGSLLAIMQTDLEIDERLALQEIFSEALIRAKQELQDQFGQLGSTSQESSC